MSIQLSNPSPSDIQSHLYTSFLEGTAPDVFLRVHGSWDAVYKLHRVVLIQSGFFRSLFTGGFSESSLVLGSSATVPQKLVLQFDDPNITRAPFEICISRLYGGGPPLCIPPSLIPSTSQPLSPAFPNPNEFSSIPEGHHPATPSFLLSLLATATYLSIPALASQALASILTTIGPYTVVKYLDFAIGKIIRQLDLEPIIPEAAIGLEHIAYPMDDQHSTHSTTSSLTVQMERRVLSSSSDHTEGDLMSPTSSSFGVLHDAASGTDPDSGVPSELTSYYGIISDKIGEACACWLARWGTDMLTYETLYEHGSATGLDSATSAVIQAQTLPVFMSPAMTLKRGSELAHAPPLIWSRGGLTAKWVSAIVSADTFFVKGERERYNFARSVVELRRREGILDAEEMEWMNMFEHGIYYTNMTLEELIEISHDVSPTTTKPYVTQATLQAALWSQSVLRHTIKPSFSSSPSPQIASTPGSREKELGITHTTADILAHISDTGQVETNMSNLYFPILGDSSIRIGDNSGDNDYPTVLPPGIEQPLQSLHTNDPSLTVSPHLTPVVNAGLKPMPHSSESNFFGLLSPKPVARSCIPSDPTGKARWSPYPPYRFSVEFWDINHLKEKSRLYSQTICYAGSLFNVYVQAVRKKGQLQLGIYLHRQSSIEPIPSPSAPSPFILNREEKPKEEFLQSSTERPPHQRVTSLPSGYAPSTPPSRVHHSPSIYPSSRSATPNSHTQTNPSTSPTISSTPGSPLSNNPSPISHMLPATTSPAAPPQPYRDPRPSISAYFSINCANVTGSSQIRFTSSPDVFSVSQSWGWKSSSLKTEEFVGVGSDMIDTDATAAGNSRMVVGKEVSLRATVVLGLV